MPKVGEVLTPLSIGDKGLLINKGDDVAFTQWSSADAGKRHVIHHMSASILATTINIKFSDVLDATDLPKDIITTIANLDDAKLGFGGIVLKEMIKNKKVKRDIQMVADEAGHAADSWALERGSSAIIVVDNDNTVLFFKEGKLCLEEIESVINMLMEK